MSTNSYGYNENLIEQQGKDAMLSSLSQCRRARVLAAATPEASKQALASGWLLEQSLRQQGIREPFVYHTSSRGKPYLVQDKGGIQFSLSHTRGLSAVALAQDAVGVDVERIGRGNEAVINRFFSEGEKDYLKSCAGEEWECNFTLCWTLKEAIAKCLDVNLLQICRDVDVSVCVPEVLKKEQRIKIPGHADLSVRSYPVANYVISGACVREEDFSLKFIDKY